MKVVTCDSCTFKVVKQRSRVKVATKAVTHVTCQLPSAMSASHTVDFSCVEKICLWFVRAMEIGQTYGTHKPYASDGMFERN